MSDLRSLRKAAINILLILSFLQVMGLVWYIFFQNSLVISIIVNSTPLTLLFFLGPALSFFLGIGGYSYGPINSFTVLFIPVIVFLVICIFFFRFNNAHERKRILIPLALIFTVLFTIFGIQVLFQKTKSGLAKLDRAQSVADQKGIFEKGIDVTYLGVSKFDDNRSFHDNSEEYFIHRIAVSFDALSTKDVEEGSYTLCLRKFSQTGEINSGGKCLIRTNFTIEPNSSLKFSGKLESDYPFWYSLVEPSIEMNNDTLVLAVTGSKSSVQREVAELMIYGSDRKIRDSGHVYGGEVVYRKTIVGPITQAGMPTD